MSLTDIMNAPPPSLPVAKVEFSYLTFPRSAESFAVAIHSQKAVHQDYTFSMKDKKTEKLIDYSKLTGGSFF